MACDYAINPLLLDAGLTLPKDVLIDHRLRGMSAERIYNLIEEQHNQDDSNGERHNQDGSSDDPPFASVLALEDFERFVYVLSVLERYPAQKCAVRVVAAFDNMQRVFEKQVGKESLGDALRVIRALQLAGDAE